MPHPTLAQQLVIEMVEDRLGPVDWKLDLFDNDWYFINKKHGGYLEVHTDGTVRACVKAGKYAYDYVSLQKALDAWKR